MTNEIINTTPSLNKRNSIPKQSLSHTISYHLPPPTTLVPYHSHFKVAVLMSFTLFSLSLINQSHTRPEFRSTIGIFSCSEITRRRFNEEICIVNERKSREDEKVGSDCKQMQKWWAHKLWLQMGSFTTCNMRSQTLTFALLSYPSFLDIILHYIHLTTPNDTKT